MIEDYWYALLGGALIGVASSVILIANGRVAGVSGILFGAVNSKGYESKWRWAFLIGLVLAGTAMNYFWPEAFSNTSHRGAVMVGCAGLLVGFGTRLGSGCTSGHGVCGISRFSMRSIIATSTFIVSGVITVLIINLF